MSATWGPVAPLGQVATTPAAGFALQNATPAILTWQVPNDGQLHRVLVVATSHCTVAATGGQVSWGFTTPDGTAKTGLQILAGGQAAGAVGHGLDGAVVGPGTTVTITQTALTIGAETIWCQLWAS